MATRPTEAELEYQGIVSAKSRYANITLTFLDVGIQMFMCLYGLSVFLETPKALRKGRARFIVLSFLIWILSAIPASIDSWVNFEDLLAAGPSGIELQRQASRPPAGHRWIAPLNQILLLLYITLGEALMIWRCFIIWRDRRWVVIAPLLTCLATIALSITAAVALTPSGVNIRWTLRLVASRILLSVLTNVLVTSLIIFKLVHTRRMVSRALPHEKKPKMYTDVMAILIESAAPVAIFGILLAISFFNIALVQRRPIQRAHWAIFNDVTSLFYYSFCALSPQMIIFRVTTGRSWTSARDSGTAGSGVFSQPIHFARPGDGQEDSESSGDTRSFSDQQVLDEKGKTQEL